MIELGLHRIRQLLSATDLPWRAIHVAGTNGKGSVCAYISAIFAKYNTSKALKDHGLQPVSHARFTSPHLLHRWDGITVNGETVDKALFEKTEASFIAKDMSDGIGASQFELMTATAFDIFRQSKVDIGIIEVGMGGRLDATNIIGEEGSSRIRQPPLACCITPIGLDHQEFLGSTEEDIAREKCGIIKPNTPVVAAAQDSTSVDRVITKCAREHGSKLTRIGHKTSPRQIWLGNGGHQQQSRCLSKMPVIDKWVNGALALDVSWKALQSLGRLQGLKPHVERELFLEVQKALAEVTWPGRLQTIDVSRLKSVNRLTPFEAILDGAHNAQGAKLLRRYLDSTIGDNPVNWLLAVSSTKDVGEILRILLRPGDIVTSCEFRPVDGMPWVSPLPAAQILQEATQVVPGDHQMHLQLETAIAMACKSAEKGGRRLVIAGSLYLVSNVMFLPRERPFSRL